MKSSVQLFTQAIFIHIACNLTCSFDLNDGTRTWRNKREKIEYINNTCSTDDLNHSTLIECKVSECKGVSQDTDPLWPTSREDIIHMYSSRSGDRFAVDFLENLDFLETEFQRLLDINTTIYVNTSSKHQEIVGLGTTLDTTNLLNYMENNSLDITYSSIIRDLFARSHSGIQLSLLRLPITRDDIINHNVSLLLRELDTSTVKAMGVESNSKIKVILSLENIDQSLDVVEVLKDISTSFSTLHVLECWGVTINQEWIFQGVNNEGKYKYIKELFPTKNIMGVTTIRQAHNILDLISNNRNIFEGLLIKSEYSSVYSILEYVRSLRDDLRLISIGSDKPQISNYGDWQNAQNYAVEILNHLKHGSNGFIEDFPVVDVLTKPKSRDCSIYSLHMSHMLHFRSPIFYAIGHFSRHVIPGSRVLKLNIFTQPNMFAAHYLAFLTPQNYIVAIVLNNNEHLLPFRMAVDGKIAAYTSIKPKSFNTIIMKQ